MASTGFPTCTTLPGVWIRSSSRITASSSPFFSICGMTAQKMRLQADKSCIFQFLWFIFYIHQFFHLLFRYQASQKFLFDDRYRLFFHRIHKEISGIIKAVCLLQLPLIFQSDRENISSSKPEGLSHTSQGIKCAINP